MIPLSHHEIFDGGSWWLRENVSCWRTTGEVQCGGSDPTALVLWTSKRSFCGRLGCVCVWQQGDAMAVKEIIMYFALVTELWHQTSMVTLIFVDPISTLLR
jgi:hypothetical protein